MATAVDMMLDPMVSVGFTFPVRKIERNFCSRVFTSSGTESGIFLLQGGESNRDRFSLKLKLDDFTSGFRTRYADMAGGWEEVVAVGGGIRTGAGSGDELNKKCEADEAAENIGWAYGAAEDKKLAGWAAAEQANCIWLISGETVTLNFRKFNAQDGTSQSCLLKG
jgi:hypothetical protein